MRVQERLSKTTYAVIHNPNCPSPFEVHLIGRGAGRLDFQALNSRDIRGYGKTLVKAAQDAFTKLDSTQIRKR